MREPPRVPKTSQEEEEPQGEKGVSSWEKGLIGSNARQGWRPGSCPGHWRPPVRPGSPDCELRFCPWWPGTSLFFLGLQSHHRRWGAVTLLLCSGMRCGWSAGRCPRGRPCSLLPEQAPSPLRSRGLGSVAWGVGEVGGEIHVSELPVFQGS